MSLTVLLRHERSFGSGRVAAELLLLWNIQYSTQELRHLDDDARSVAPAASAALWLRWLAGKRATGTSGASQHNNRAVRMGRPMAFEMGMSECGQQ